MKRFVFGLASLVFASGVCAGTAAIVASGKYDYLLGAGNQPPFINLDKAGSDQLKKDFMIVDGLPKILAVTVSCDIAGCELDLRDPKNNN